MPELTDQQIAELLQEEKSLPGNYRNKLLGKMKARGSAYRGEVKIQGANGSTFYIKTRQSIENPFTFSVILVYAFPDSNKQFRLRRYNGGIQPHRNKLEKEKIGGFHIHQATERYQTDGFDEDAYAEETVRYSDLHGALKCMIEDCNFIRPAGDPLELL